jgi:DNA anti-recombination protein RmuC
MVNKKVEKFSVDNLDDSRIKIVFGTVYILGSLVIFFSSKFMTSFIAMLILILLMSSYIVGIFFLQKKMNLFIRDEQLGDSFYYLGFLFTLTALVATLLNINIESVSIEELLNNFGIAIITTLIGLTGRILFSQFRESFDELKEESEAKISESVRKLKTQLDSSIDILRQQSISIAQNTDKTLQDSSASLRRFMEENNKVLQETTEKSKKAIEEFNSRASEISSKLSKINIPTDKFKEFEDGVVSIVGTLGKLEKDLKNSSVDSEIHKITEKFKSLSSSISSQSKLLNDEFVNSKETLENLSKNLVDVAKFISINLKK